MNKRVEQALRTLRAIRQRFEAESNARSGRMRSYTVQVALGYADMLWISAAIEALEKTGTRAPADPQESERLRAL